MHWKSFDSLKTRSIVDKTQKHGKLLLIFLILTILRLMVTLTIFFMLIMLKTVALCAEWISGFQKIYELPFLDDQLHRRKSEGEENWRLSSPVK